MTKYDGWNWRDIYRFPLAYLWLWPLIVINYERRSMGLEPDEWYWADVIAYRWGYVVRS